MNEPKIQKRVMFAQIHQDMRGQKAHVLSIRYFKKDGTPGQKERVTKTAKLPSGEGKYRGNVKYNHVLLLQDLETGGFFEVCIDLITHYNNYRIIH